MRRKKKSKYPRRTERWKIGDHRKIGGHYFHLYVVTEPVMAKYHARTLREDGHHVRLEKTADGKDYKVWRSNSDRLRKRKKRRK